MSDDFTSDKIVFRPPGSGIKEKKKEKKTKEKKIEKRIRKMDKDVSSLTQRQADIAQWNNKAQEEQRLEYNKNNGYVIERKKNADNHLGKYFKDFKSEYDALTQRNLHSATEAKKMAKKAKKSPRTTDEKFQKEYKKRQSLMSEFASEYPSKERDYCDWTGFKKARAKAAPKKKGKKLELSPIFASRRAPTFSPISSPISSPRSSVNLSLPSPISKPKKKATKKAPTKFANIR